MPKMPRRYLLVRKFLREANAPSTGITSFLYDIIEFVQTYGRTTLLLTGGFCLLLYTDEIGQFPEGLEIGEGLAFYLLASGFLLVYLFFVVTVTALGCVLMRWPVAALQAMQLRFRSRRTKSFVEKEQISFRPMWDPLIFALGLIGLYLLLAIGKAGHAAWQYYVVIPVLQGFLYAGLLIYAHMGRVVSSAFRSSMGIATPTHDEAFFKDHRFRKILLSLIFLSPLVIGKAVGEVGPTVFADAAFRTAQLRKDRAVIHVKKPWSDRVAQSGMEQQASFLGDDYRAFAKVDVLLRSIGQKVVIRLPTSSGGSGKSYENLSIPSDSIYVE